MCDTELLVGYLYNDLADADRVRVETHLRTCAACRDELASLRSVRADLTSWAPPEPDFGFRIVRGSREAPRAWRARLAPAFGLAAAATLVLAAAAAIANVEVRYDGNGFAVRTGRSAPARPETGRNESASARAAAGASYGGIKPVDEATVAALQKRITELEQTTRALQERQVSAPVRQVSAPAGVSAAEWNRVHDLIAQSESRQQTMLALQIQRLARDIDFKRATDLARVQQGLDRLGGMTTAETAAHRELANIVYRMANQK
jgi:putative zinc finger protein